MNESSDHHTFFTLDNSWTVEFPTDPGGVLRLGPGLVRVETRFAILEQDEEGWNTLIGCELRLADSDGRLWQSTSRFFCDWLFYPVVDLSRREPGQWLHKSPEQWRVALEERSLIAGATHTYDDRFYRFVWLGNTGFCWQFKYFGAKYDLAALDESTIVVKLYGLWCSWNPVPAAGEDGAPLPLSPPRPPLSEEEMEAEEDRLQQEGESGDVDEAKPIAYTIEAGRVLFRSSNTAWYSEGNEDSGSRPVEQQLVFRRVEGDGEPQQIVTFHPGTFLTPAALDDRSTAGTRTTTQDGFVRMGSPYDPPLEFQTDSGGRLAVLTAPDRYSVRLDKHPNSDTEPVDVVRARVRLTDEGGDTWEAVSLFTPEVFFEKLIALDGIVWTHFAEDGERDWLLSGVRALLDDGAWRYAFLPGELVAFRGEQRPRVDIALGEEARRFLVRMTGLVGRRRPVTLDRDYIVLDPEDRAGERTRWEADALLPPVEFAVGLHDLIFRNTTFAVDDGFWHRNPIPIPVVFSRIGHDKPSEGVRFIPSEK